VQFATQIYRWRNNHQKQLDSASAQPQQPQCNPTTMTTTMKKCPIQIVIVTYSLLQTRFQVANTLRECAFECIIADESHNLKQINSQRCQLALPLLQSSKRLVLLSGTPALNRPVELWPQLHALDARGLLFGSTSKNGMSYNEYTKRYCNAHRTRFGYDVKGISNAEELHACLKSVMIRRLKSDVLQDLPSKQRTIIPVIIMDAEKERESRETMMQLRNARRAVSEITDLDADDVANSAQWEARKLLMQGMTLLQSYSTDINSLSDLTVHDFNSMYIVAYQASGIAKAPSTTEYILDWLEGSDSAQKLVVFAHHKDVLDYIETAISKKYKGKLGMIRIDGSVSPAERALKVKKFQQQSNSSGNIRLALLSMTAAGVGLTLTAASNIIFAELHWTPGILAQAEDRCHRIGQASSVNVMYCICKDEEVSVDMTLWSMLSSKVGNLGRVVDGERGQLDATENELDHKLATPRRTGASSVEEDLSSFFASSKKSSSAAKRSADSIVKGTIQSFFMKQSGKKEQRNDGSSTGGAQTSTSNATVCISLLDDEDDDDIGRATCLTYERKAHLHNKKKQNNVDSLMGRKTKSTSNISACISLMEDDGGDIGRGTSSTYQKKAQIQIQVNSFKTKDAKQALPENVMSNTSFICHGCTFENQGDVNNCVVCGTPRVRENLQADPLSTSWSCCVCTYANLIDDSKCEMCGTMRSFRYSGKDRNKTASAEKTYSNRSTSDGNDFDDDDEWDEPDLAAIDLMTESHLTKSRLPKRHSTISQSPDLSTDLGESRKDSEILSFAVSLNSGRIALYLTSSGKPLHVNFEITNVLTKESADELEELHYQRQVPKATNTQSIPNISFDDGAIRQVLSALESDTLNILPCQDNLQRMCEEVKQFITCYLSLREVEKKVVKESGQAITASSLKQSAARLLISTITGSTERFQGGAKERSIDNIKNGCATAEDKAVLSGQGCAWCAKPFLCAKGATYCSQSCVDEGRVRRGGMFSSSKIREQLFALEHGKCTKVSIRSIKICLFV
jgi:SWI/SNF-related matrix-associated actin-dependent regulator 1 of chromatin subfamily A